MIALNQVKIEPRVNVYRFQVRCARGVRSASGLFHTERSSVQLQQRSYHG